MKTQLPVFVYGTLRNGFGNYSRLLKGNTEKEVVGAMTDGAIYPVRPSGGFPCLTEEDGFVVGELMYIKPNIYDKTLRSLDWLEGYNKTDQKHSMYIRKKKLVDTPLDGVVDAWVYVWNTDYRPITTNRIPSGCWKTFEMAKLMERRGIQ